ncbi:hypothetical protein [Methylobacterium sp. W2]|uniref:hypothetical protein n=1 Tax=Methylobacterium sp. W2 TaxID=2598107 RepID=UPI001D0CD807|nr:hypothetical protein [Methylobacterium sp. W2]
MGADQKRAYAIADNEIATLTGWDRATLALVLDEFAIHRPVIDPDLSVIGFEIAELGLPTGGLEEEHVATRAF